MVERKSLKELCSDIIVPMRDRPKVFDGTIPWCRIEDIEGMYFNKSLSGLKVSEEIIKKMNLKVFPTGSVICSCSATLGVCAINTQPLITNQTFIGLVCSDKLNNRFLYYYMLTRKRELESLSTTGTIPYISRVKFENLQIPIPPLSEQNRIVGILDTFTESIENLKNQITQRRKQYEYYRDKLLDLEGKPGVEMKTVEESIISLKTGLNPRKNFKLNEVGHTIPYITGKDIFHNKINVSDKTDLIDEKALSLINKRACLESGLLLFASTGTGTVGRMAVINDYSNNWGISETLYAIKVQNVLLPQYLMFCLYSDKIKKQFESKISRGSVPHLKVIDLLKTKIPIISLADQTRIVSILNQFESSISNLEQQLSFRQKQYEYYRNKLLTFK